MSRAFFAPFGKTCHVFLPAIPAKDVAHISRHEVTLLNALYLIPSSMAMVSRKEVLTRGIDDSLEVRYASKPVKKDEEGPTEEDFPEAMQSKKAVCCTGGEAV